MMHRQRILGFTLVELIVVITIVGILSTVGFVSYSGYLAGARDSNRISQMVKLSDSLQVYSATKTLPLPDNYIEITASGTVIAYQGEVGVDVLETIDYTNGGADPKDDNYYTYYLTKDRRSMQLMAMMEEQTSVAGLTKNTAYAADYEDRFPKTYGRKLGTLTYSDPLNSDLFNTPANLVSTNITAGFLDVFTTTVQYTSHFGNNGSITGVGKILGAAILGEGTLAGIWSFDTISGLDVTDETGRGNNGVLSGSTLPVSIIGQKGNALDFSSIDGSSGGIVKIVGNSDLNSPAFTFSFLLQPNLQSTDIAAINSHVIKNFAKYGNDNEAIFTFKWSNAGGVVLNSQMCKVFLTDGSTIEAQISSILDISIWNHIVCTFDGEELRAYLNGNFESSVRSSGFVYDGEADFIIGAAGPGPDSQNLYFDGKIDEVYLYKKALDSKDIEILYDTLK